MQPNRIQSSVSFTHLCATLSKSKLIDWTHSLRVGKWVSNWWKQTKTKMQKLGTRSCDSNMVSSGPKGNILNSKATQNQTALQSLNLCQSYLFYTAPVKVWMLIGLSNICLRKICWKKWETNTNTTYYEWLRKAGFLAFSRSGLSPCAKQLVICANQFSHVSDF